MGASEGADDGQGVARRGCDSLRNSRGRRRLAARRGSLPESLAFEGGDKDDDDGEGSAWGRLGERQAARQ